MVHRSTGELPQWLSKTGLCWTLRVALLTWFLCTNCSLSVIPVDIKQCDQYICMVSSVSIELNILYTSCSTCGCIQSVYTCTWLCTSIMSIKYCVCWCIWHCIIEDGSDMYMDIVFWTLCNLWAYINHVHVQRLMCMVHVVGVHGYLL